MLGDAQLDASEAQIRSFRLMNGQYYDTLHDILRKYESIVEDYRILRSDYEEEKENREKYKRQARGQDKNPFVLFLVDGDGYVFKDLLIKNGTQGGVTAAQLLGNGIRDRLHKLGGLDHCRVVVRIYCNLALVSRALYKAGITGSQARAMAPVTAAFSGAKGGLDFIDVDPSSGTVAGKVEENFRLFADSSQCKHIFFAGCHESRYIPLLSPYLGKDDKVTLVKAASQQPEYSSLDLPIIDFSSVFRNTPLPLGDVGSIKGSATKNAPPQPELVSASPSVSSERLNDFPNVPAPKNGPVAKNGASTNGPASLNEESGESSTKTPCSHFHKNGWCKFGNKCKFDHTKPGDKKMSKNWRDGNAFADDWGNNSPTEPPFADDWGAGSKKSRSDFADDWQKPPQKKASCSQSKFSDDWNNGPEQASRAGSISSRAQKPGSISELSMGSRHQEETRPHPAETLRSGSISEPKVKEDRPQLRKFSSAFTTAADLPRPSPETEGMIPINKYGDRLDFYLPRPTQEEYTAYTALGKEPGRKPCNDYQLKGHCWNLAAGQDCEYDHNPLSADLFHVLKVIVQGYPCPKQGACRKSDCFNGHVCQRPGCRGQPPCKFKHDYRAHNLDPKVAEWVPAIDLEEREPDDSASVTMGESVPEPEPKPVTKAEIKPEPKPELKSALETPDFNPEVVEWHPESAAWSPDDAILKPDTAEWKPTAKGWQPDTKEWKPDTREWKPDATAWKPDTVAWKPNTAEWKPDTAEWKSEASTSSKFHTENWKPGVVDWNPSASTWKSGHVDLSDIDSDTDSIAPEPEKEILDLGAEDAPSGSIFSPKARDGRLDSVMQTGESAPKKNIRPLVDTPPANGLNGKHAPVQPATNLMDDDWGNPPDGAGSFAETAEPVNFDDDDWGSAPAGVDNPPVADEPVDFADDWGPSNRAPKRQAAPYQQNGGYGGNRGGGASPGGTMWPSEILKQQRKNEYDHLLWTRTVD